MAAGLETAIMVEEFKKQSFRGEATDLDNHELLSSSQVTFFTVVPNG
jgi:hypothetical protein